VRKGIHSDSSRGSALLIVLGFLSFMIISAVSFAIYMRIERQATSNYRHTLVARHLLSSALVQSIKEVDQDLGILYRFPSHSDNWDGLGNRTYLSVSSSTNGFARVVSFDSLAYVPALFMSELQFLNNAHESGIHPNWVQLAAPIERVRSSTVNNGIPTFYFGGSNIVGRYAFVCLNISDLLNINGCTNLHVRSTGVNRVNVADVFTSASIVNDFESRIQKDIYYPTVLDFYAGMHDGDVKDFPNSPYHIGASGGSNRSALDNATNHIFVTDGFARVQKPQQAVCNVLSNGVAATLLDGDYTKWEASFKTAMGKALPGYTTYRRDGRPVFGYILADYLNDPSVGPMRLDVPSVKLAPMINQIAVSGGDINFYTKLQPGQDPSAEKKKYNVFVRPLGRGRSIDVGYMFPFRSIEALKNTTFNLELVAEVYLIKTSSSISEQQLMPGNYVSIGKASKTVSVSVSAATTMKNTMRAEKLIFSAQELPDIQLTETGNVNVDCRGQSIKLAIVVNGYVKQGVYFDSVPHYSAQGVGSADDLNFKDRGNKLYFQQQDVYPVPADESAEIPEDPGLARPFAYTCLKCPDPRYNFAVENWYSSSENDLAIAVNSGAFQDELLSTLFGKEGRDSDMFMFVSGLEKLQSPGELGFLVRPYANSDVYNEKSLDFRGRTVAQLSSLTDYENFYRTVRLYDHGASYRRDPIYDYFYAEDESINVVRVNPHSDLPVVLSCAISRTPLDYYYAFQNQKTITHEKETFDKNSESKKAWPKFAENWLQCMLGSQTLLKPTGGNKRLYEIYGDAQQTLSNNRKWTWYSGDITTIFDQPISGNGELFEVDRKMLYSFSLESFSDRQQLFLYIIQAEATGTASGSSGKSSAGGRAVAVVWRDPDLNPKLPSSLNYHDTKILYFKQLDN
jgi:hypothetical protein